MSKVNTVMSEAAGVAETGFRADRMARRAFEQMSGQPAPEHLVDLIDSLEAMRLSEWRTPPPV